MDEYYEDEKEIFGIEDDIYEEEGRESLVEGDELSVEEAGFLEGYDNPDTVKCAYCGTPLIEEESIVEIVLKGKLYRFCSEECLEEFKREQEEENI